MNINHHDDQLNNMEVIEETITKVTVPHYDGVIT